MFSSESRKKIAILLSVVGISMYALFLRINSLAHRELWNDELNQLKIMNGSFFQLIKSLPGNEISTYLNWDHFLIYPFFKIFSFNKWGLVIPHIIVTILGFYLLYLICRHYFKTIWGYIVTFSVICFNATLVYHATEIRPYAVLPTLALACLYLSGVLINEDKLSTIKKFLIGAFFLLTICFHTYGIFILFFCLVYSLLNKPATRTFGNIFKDVFMPLIIAFSVGLPFWLFCVFGPSRVQIKLDVYQFIPSPFVDITGFLKGIFGNLLGFKNLYFLLGALAFPFVFPYKERFRQISFLFIMVLLPVMLVFACDMAGRCYFIQRQFIWVMPYFAIFLGWSCDSCASYIFTKFLQPIKGGK